MHIAIKVAAASALLLALAGAASAGNGDTIVPIYSKVCKTDLVCATKVQDGYMKCQNMVETDEEAMFCREMKQKLMKLCTTCMPVNISFERVRLPLAEAP